MLAIPPSEIPIALVDIRNGHFVIDEDATPRQKKVFEEWCEKVENLERDLDDPDLDV